MIPSRGSITIACVLLSLLATIPLSSQAAEEKKVDKEKTTLTITSGLIAKALEAVTKEVDRMLAPARPWGVVGERAGNPLQPVPGPQADQRHARLTAYSNAMQSWIADAAGLTDVQVKQLAEISSEMVEEQKREYAKGKDVQQRQKHQIPDFFAVRMTCVDGAATRIDLTRLKRKLHSLHLTEQQNTRLEEAIQERNEFYADSALGHVLNLVDRELYLTESQRTALAALIGKQMDFSTQQSYAFHAQPYYLPLTSLDSGLSEPQYLELLHESQKTRAKAMGKTNSNGWDSDQHIMCTVNTAPEENEKFLTQALKAQKVRLQEAMEVRVHFLDQALTLADSESRHLQVAAKGTVDTVAAQWKIQTRRQIENFMKHARQQGQGVNFGLSVPNIQQLEKSKLWLKTVEKLPNSDDGDAALGDREETRRAAMAKYILALLDRELWMTEDQRIELYNVVFDQLPSPDYLNSHQHYYGAMPLICIPLFRASKRDLRILSESQKAAFEELKTPFTFNGNYAQAQLPNGGQIHITIPK